MLKGFVNTFSVRPMMPDNIKTLVLPSQLNFPVVPAVSKPQKKSRSQRRKEKHAQLVQVLSTTTLANVVVLILVKQVPDLIPGEEDMDMSSEDNGTTANAEEVKANLTHRYVPQFNSETNDCTWIWVP